MLRCLEDMGVTGSRHSFIKDFLYGRNRTPALGLPQGCVLNPPPFDILLAGIFPLLPVLARDVRMTIFADDIYSWTSVSVNMILEMRMVSDV